MTTQDRNASPITDDTTAAGSPQLRTCKLCCLLWLFAPLRLSYNAWRSCLMTAVSHLTAFPCSYLLKGVLSWKGTCPGSPLPGQASATG